MKMMMVLKMMMLLMLMNVMILAGSGRHGTAAIYNDVTDGRPADGHDGRPGRVSRTLSSRWGGWATLRKMGTTLQSVRQLILVVEITGQRLELPWRRGDLRCEKKPKTKKKKRRSSDRLSFRYAQQRQKKGGDGGEKIYLCNRPRTNQAMSRTW